MSEEQDLQAFLINNPELERLEGQLAEFNIFETLGAVNVELRHSEFLAYLFDPQQNHGLGDSLIKRLLQALMLDLPPGSLPVRPIDLELWDLDDLEVRREWQGIDILLISARYLFVVTIENKIHSGEHADQLKHYREYIQHAYPNWKAVFLFLTPEGETPSDKDHYIPVSYRLVAEVLERLVKARQASLGPEVLMLLSHYVRMLKRYIVNDEITELCRLIYRKHKKAIDLIRENIPTRQVEIKELLESLVKQPTSQVVFDHSTLNYIVFIPKTWDTPALRFNEGFSTGKNILLFSFENKPDQLRITLTIGPGPVDKRQRLLDMAKTHTPPLNSAYKNLNKSWNNIFILPILNREELEELEFEDIVQKIQTTWQKFLSNDLPQLDHVLKTQDWIWESKVIE